MKKKAMIGLLTAGCMMALCACAEKEPKQNLTVNVEEIPAQDSAASEQIASDSAMTEEGGAVDGMMTEETASDAEMTTDDTWTEETADQTQQDAAEAMGTVEFQSDLGYSMSYDASVFATDTVDGKETFTYRGENGTDEKIYIAVSRYANTDAQTLAEKLAAESGVEGVEVWDAYFGAESVDAKEVYVLKETDGEQMMQIYHTIPMGGDTLLVETVGYVGMPEAAEVAYEETLASFRVR